MSLSDVGRWLRRCGSRASRPGTDAEGALFPGASQDHAPEARARDDADGRSRVPARLHACCRTHACRAMPERHRASCRQARSAMSGPDLGMVRGSWDAAMDQPETIADGAVASCTHALGHVWG
eukprot:189451-Rhodomonas_salina.5